MTFHHHPPLVLPELVQQNGPSGRVYYVRNGNDRGQKYPSITRVLGAKPKPELHEWRKRIGKEAAQQITQQAAQRGTALHTLSEMYLGNNKDAYDAALTAANIPVRELWTKLSTWLNDHVTGVYAQECSLYSNKLKVAGRTDLIADIDGVLSIVDFKNSRKPKQIEHIEDYFLQGTFYSCALFELTNLRARQIIFPIVSPTSFQLFVTNPNTHFEALRQRIDEFYLTYDASSCDN